MTRVHSHTHTRQNKSLRRLTRTRAQRLQTCHVQLQWQRRLTANDAVGSESRPLAGVSMVTALQFIWKRVDERLVYKGCDLWCDWQQRVDACGLW